MQSGGKIGGRGRMMMLFADGGETACGMGWDGRGGAGKSFADGRILEVRNWLIEHLLANCYFCLILRIEIFSVFW